MLNKTLREFLLPYTEAQRPEVGAEIWHEARWSCASMFVLAGAQAGPAARHIVPAENLWAEAPHHCRAQASHALHVIAEDRPTAI